MPPPPCCGSPGHSGRHPELLFRGISKALKGVSECDGVLWAKALQEGVDAAYKAVMKPAEGTILTVARLSAAKAGQAAQENSYFEFVHEAAVEEARVALANTVNQNPVLKKAGVIDAGGKGWLWALEAMLLALRGEDVTISESAPVNLSRSRPISLNLTQRTSPYLLHRIHRLPGRQAGTRRSCEPSSKSWATVWFWWTTMRSSRSTFTPIIPAPHSRKP